MKTILKKFIQKYVWIEPAGDLNHFAFWQRRIVTAVLAANSVLGILALSPSIPYFLDQGMYLLVGVFVTGHILAVVSWLSVSWPHQLRAFAVVLVFFVAGVFSLINFGAPGGFTVLSAVPILTSIFFGGRPSFAALSVNAIILMFAGIYMQNGYAIGTGEFREIHTLDKWFVMCINYLLLNAVIISAFTVLIRGLRKALEDQSDYAKSLESRRMELERLNRALAAEIGRHAVTEKERKQLEDEVLHMQRLQAMHTIAGGIAHDFNNILTGVIGYLGLLTEHLERDPTGLKMVLEVQKGTGRAKDLVRKIQTFSRKGEARMESLRFADLIQECADLLKPGMGGIEFSLVNCTKDDRMMGDSTQLHQVIVNLMTNAVHAMDGNGRLSVKLEECIFDGPQSLPDPRCLKIIMADTGPGIPQENIRRIFEPYFTTKTKDVGSGLGLAVVLSIIKGHNGIIDVQSTEGEGTVFEIRLPVMQPLRTSGNLSAERL